jgi:hypothetical protein
MARIPRRRGRWLGALLLGYGTLIALVFVLPSDSRLLAVLSMAVGVPLMLAISGAIDEAHTTIPRPMPTGLGR